MRILFSNVIAIYRRELQSYFASPLAYAIAGLFWLLGGLFMTLILSRAIAQAVFVDQQFGGTGPSIDVPYEFLINYLGLLGSLSMFVLPILSMGLYAEERKQGTLELLATSPITNWAVALGKLLGVVTFYIGLVLPLMVCEAIALSTSDPPIHLMGMFLGHAGLILLAASVLSLGMFVSSLTESTVLAAIMTFVLVLLLWLIEAIAEGLGGVWGDVLSHLSLLSHYTDFTEGVLDTSGLLLFITYIVLGLFLTAQSIDALRFQRS